MTRLNSQGNNHLKEVASAINRWLDPANRRLKLAIERTVEEKLFSFEDIKHQIRSLKQELTLPAFERWVSRSSFTPGSLSHRHILALHAGNLPLAGIQDILAIAITGGSYSGKLSSKDPYLLKTLIVELEHLNIFENAAYSTRLDDLGENRADYVLFSGATESVSNVTSRLKEKQLIDKNSRLLLRTAHYSIAYIQSTRSAVLESLTESMLRYDGKGCRSTGLVIAPFSFDKIRCEFTDYIEAYWLRNPPHSKTEAVLEQRYAYNEGVGHTQLWLNHLLIEETEDEPNLPGLVHWVVGDLNDLERIALKLENSLQSIYITENEDQSLSDKVRGKCESLHRAQQPPIDWQPDGIDPLEWLKKQESIAGSEA